MGKFIDLTGKVFGRLTVIGRAENINGRVAWNCLCECGNTCIVRGDHLRNFHTTSCGCLNIEKFIERHTTHGMTKTRIFKIWQDMIQRYKNPNANNYERYGGRGITVCERWLKFENFYADVSTLPHYLEEGYTLDRINNDGNYCPENVR